MYCNISPSNLHAQAKCITDALPMLPEKSHLFPSPVLDQNTGSIFRWLTQNRQSLSIRNHP